jgi:photosystem II stability/assembly factor-like uncharacterized protein
MNSVLRVSILIALLWLICVPSQAQWIASGSGMGQIWGLVIDPTNAQNIYAASNSTGMWKSTNGGISWTQINVGLSNTTLQALAISKSSPDILMCGTASGANSGMYLSADAGASWFQVNTGIAEASIGVQTIAIDPTNTETAYMATFVSGTDATNGLYKTTNAGLNWSPITTGIGIMKNFLSIVINPLNPKVLYAGTSFSSTSATTEQARIYKSRNAGASWVDVSTGLPPTQGATTHDPVRALSIQAVDTNRVIAGLFYNDTLGGVYLTTNGGTSWTRRASGLPTSTGTLPRSILIRPGSTTEFYVGLGRTGDTDCGPYRSTDAGLTWTSFVSGPVLNTYTIRALDYAPSNRWLYAGAAHTTDPLGQGIFKNQLPAVGVRTQPQGIPTDFVLSQNYPNPFNPGTKIKYGLPERAYVTLKVYDVLGREVATLVDEEVNAGYHQESFDGSRLSSGVYFYRLSAGKFSTTKRLMLLK